MKRFIWGLSLLFLASSIIFFSCSKDDQDIDMSASIEQAPLIKYSSPSVIEGQYIVVYNEDAADITKSAVTSSNYEEIQNGITSFTKDVLRENNIDNKEISYSYAKTLKGVALKLDDKDVEKLRSDERVAYIE